MMPQKNLTGKITGNFSMPVNLHNLQNAPNESK